MIVIIGWNISKVDAPHRRFRFNVTSASQAVAQNKTHLCVNVSLLPSTSFYCYSSCLSSCFAPPPSNLNSWVLYYMHVILCYLITIPMCPHPHSLLLGRRPPVCSLNTVHTVHYTRLCTSPHWVPLSCLCVSLVTLLADITTWPLRHSRNNWNQLAPVSVKCWALYSCSNQHPPPPFTWTTTGVMYRCNV